MFGKMNGGVQGPPGLGGGVGGFGEVGQAAFNYQEMVKGMKRPKDIENNMEKDSINMRKYVKELSKVCWDIGFSRPPKPPKPAFKILV